MLEIYLARHGQNIDNVNGILNGHRDGVLTTLGVEQAKQTAEFIRCREISFSAVYSSPLQRAYVTAEIIATALTLPSPTVLPELIERDFGVMTGQPVAEIRTLCSPDIIEADPIVYFLAPAGAETFPEVLARAKQVLAQVAQAHESGAVLLVTHGDIGKMLYAAYYDLDWQDVLVNFHFGNGELLLLSERAPLPGVLVFQQEQHNH